jgi:hypothetical protein
MKRHPVRLTLAIIAIVIILIFLGVKVLSTPECHDIMGQGYYMGEDSEPIVVGNTCD